MKLLDIIYKIRKRLGFTKPDDYLDYLRRHGVRIGKGTHAFSHNIYIDSQRPWMLSIGDYCKLTHGVIILQHDYSRSVLRRVYGDVIGESMPTSIGDNVFIGMNSVILMGANIGNNVIIGAGSVVKGNIPDNVVIAGSPARVICSLEEYYLKRKQRYINEAILTATTFYDYYNRYPSIEEMGAFFPLFLERSMDALKTNKIFTALSGDDEEDIINHFLKSESYYPNFEKFLDDVKTNRLKKNEKI